MRLRFLLVVPLFVSLIPPAEAGIIFGRKKKPTPNERVPELIAVLKSDKDETHRTRAAEELRQYDPAAFPDIVPALVGALQSDTKPGVRAEAAQTLGKLRPVSPLAGQALEQALEGDASMRVRLQARSSLLQYHWAGYKGKKVEPPPLTGKEPPLADEGKFPPAINTAGKALPRLAPVPSASPPPPGVIPTEPVPSGPRLLPSGPQVPTPRKPTTSEPPLAPPAKGPETGPDLGPSLG